ncbi:MAG: LysE family translocator [Beijerinckiaceae bacterium]|nr:LysE family translocator [Beijerinckiaceae bacterium]
MPDFQTLMLFSIACLALTATPGPDMLLIASRSVSQGRSAGFASLAGIQAGTYIHALAMALGLSQLFLVVPLAYDIVRYAGAAYLLYLAIQVFRSSAQPALSAPDTQRYPLTQMFWQGMLTNLLNPKMVLFVLALFPQFVRPEAGSVAVQVLVLATVLNLIGLLVNGIVILMASRMGLMFAGRGRFRRVSQLFLGTVFAGLAVRLVLEERR